MSTAAEVILVILGLWAVVALSSIATALQVIRDRLGEIEDIQRSRKGAEADFADMTLWLKEKERRDKVRAQWREAGASNPDHGPQW